MLGAIRAVTTTVPDLDAVEQAYVSYLHYHPVARGRLDDATATSWNAPAAAGSRWLAMQPASGEPTCLRFVERPATVGFRALTTFGWNATEITVQDVDALAPRFADSPFQIIGAPADLDGVPMIRAMQLLGPAGECLYLTRIAPGSGFDLAPALSPVGRVFITVVGGPDIEALRSFYAARFGNQPTPAKETRIRVLSRANGLPAEETKHGLAVLPLADGTLFELDRYPPGTGPRPCRDGDLPPGMAIVTCEVESIDGATIASTLPPYVGARSATLRGAAGELIELVTTADR
ncbi:hypothetical protein [Roseiterribacter gracilis]|uniref:VOC domain-containing protein n=1 Tax=Roseiterribacter gracilis TaxID=2812848 RepID=A0A8S8XGT6_9PROT|nr:hypothetical protein TMPK1_33260 [Rhodospirillales bacterium TMPK1]